MLRVRHNDGSTTRIQGEAVEFLDLDGNLGVLLLQDKKGTVRILTPSDALFRAYCNTQGMTPARVHVHEPFPLQTAPLGL